jgi:ribosomal peptide maturation radical SAM protein 1
MPFGALERPSLGLSLLQAGAQRAGHASTVHYFGFPFAECTGLDDYIWVNDEVPYTAFAGDWLFTRDLHGDNPDRDCGYLNEVLRDTWQLDNGAIERLLRIRNWVEPFLDRCVTAVSWNEIDVVGFTSTFQQNLASLALAKRLAERFPHLTVVFGGANWEGPMGVELHQQYGFVDFSCSGEADETFPALLEHLAAKRSDWRSIPGLVYRSLEGASVSTGPARLIEDLDTLCPPMFDDYFDALTSCSVAANITPILIMETSRGCWWGARSHCTFCGLNGGSMAFRSKSPDRAFTELRDAVNRFEIRRIGLVDNILDMRYFRTFLPRLAEEMPGLDLFYEVKSTLTNRQIETLVKAGVHEIQPGIESLSDHVLELIRKGTSALRNVQLLKWCAEHGLKADWNLLFGAPGETTEDYVRMLPLVRAIRHLEPPTACGRIRLDRFSPYHDNAESFGITSVTPMAPYRWLFPFADDALSRVAYYFDFEHSDLGDPGRYTEAIQQEVAAWQLAGRGTLLQIISESDHVVIVDSRHGVQRHEFTGWKAAVYLTCDSVTAVGHLLGIDGVRSVPVAELVEFVNWCASNNLMLVNNRECLSLAVRTPARRYESGPQLRRGRRLAVVGASGASS